MTTDARGVHKRLVSQARNARALQARFALAVLSVLSASAALTGCAIVSSQALGTGQPAQGLLYHLPKALLPIELVATSTSVQLRMLQPKLVADPAQRYLLTHPHSPMSSDNVKVEFDDSGLLLSKLTMDSTEQSLDVLKAVAKARAIGRTEGANDPEVVLASGDFDPDDGSSANQRLVEDMNDALQHRVALWAAQCVDKTGPAEVCPLVSMLKPHAAPVAAAPAASAPSKPAELLLRVSAQRLQPATQAERAPGVSGSPLTEADSMPADCRVGLCYRSQQAFRLRLAIGGAFIRETVVMLPNQSPPIALAMTRAPFVKTEYTVAFNGQGQPKSMDTKRPSSMLALVSWPLDVYKAVLQATAELVQLRIDDHAKAKALAQSELDTAKELKRLQDEMKAFQNKTPESAGAGTTLLSIRLGAPTNLLPDGGDAGKPSAAGAASGAASTPCTAGQPCDGNTTGGVKK